MKISEIAEESKVYHVTLTPNWFEKLLGVKEKVVRFKDSGYKYLVGSQTKYIRDDGKVTGNHSWIAQSIDVWRRKF